MERRDFLKGLLGAGTALSLSSNSFSLRQKEYRDFESLANRLEKHSEWRKDNRGSTVYLGNINNAGGMNASGTTTYALGQDIHNVDQMLDEGYAPEEIVGGSFEGIGNGGTPLWNLMVRGETSFKLVHLKDNLDLELSAYADDVEEAFVSLFDDGYEFDVEHESVVPSEEDLNNLEGVGGKADFKSDLDLSGEYTSLDQIPVFLVERSLLPNSGGHSDGWTGTAYVEATENDQWNKSVSIHELGHSLLGATHTYLREGAMSYNPKSGDDLYFGPRTQLHVERLLNADLEAQVKDMHVSGMRNGEDFDETVSKIDSNFELADVSRKKAARDAARNLSAYLEDKWGYNMSDWEFEGVEEGHEIIEADEEKFDRLEYGHQQLNMGIEFVVGSYIEEMSISDSGSKENRYFIE